MTISEITAMLGDNVRAVEDVLTMKLPDLPPITMDDVRRYVPSGFADSAPLRDYNTQFAALVTNSNVRQDTDADRFSHPACIANCS